MAKYFGRIGFATSQENPADSGIYEDVMVEHNYHGDVLDLKSRYKSNSINGTNDLITIDVEFSIMADSFAYQNLSNMKYIEYLGEFWKIETISPDRPRLKITIGGIWNGSIADRTSPDSEENPGLE